MDEDILVDEDISVNEDILVEKTLEDGDILGAKILI